MKVQMGKSSELGGKNKELSTSKTGHQLTLTQLRKENLKGNSVIKTSQNTEHWDHLLEYEQFFGIRMLVTK